MKTHEELTQATSEEVKFYNDSIYGLPKRPEGSAIPYGSEAHIVKHFKTTIDIVKPTNILEIGLNLGWSSALWLNLTHYAKVFSIDISDRNETIEAGTYLSNLYPGRFEFLIWDSADAFKFLKRKDFQLCFVDGSHEEDAVEKDIWLALKLEIEYLLFDDIYERYGPGVMKAINKFPALKLVKDMDNLRLYRNLIYE